MLTFTFSLRSLLLGWCSLLLIGASALPAAAQTATCPPHALLSIARAGAACVNLDAAMACYGSGSVTSRPPRAAVPDSSNWATVLCCVIWQSVTVAPDPADAEAVSLASLAICVSPRATDVVNVLLINDARFDQSCAAPVELTMQAVGALHVRASPASDAAVIADLAVNNSVIANGRSGDWLRVTVPATGAVGWAAAASLAGDARALPAVEPGAKVAQPFQIVAFRSNGNPACGDLLPAGALLQTPSTEWKDAVSLTINGADLRLAGTIFMALEDDTLNVTALDGVATVVSDGEMQIIPAGGTASVTSGSVSPATPYNASLTAALPVNNLPRRFQVTPPQTQDALDARIAALTVPTPTAVPVQPTPSNVCRRIVAHRSTTWSGPGEDYEALAQLEAGVTINPVLGDDQSARRGLVAVDQQQLDRAGGYFRTGRLLRSVRAGRRTHPRAADQHLFA